MPELKQDAVRERILALIEKGELSARLPSAGRLAERFSVNVRTMGKVLANLAREGVLLKRKGGGSFVRSSRELEIIVRCPRQAFDPGSYYAEILEGVSEAGEAKGCRLDVSDSALDYELGSADGVVFLGQGEYESYLKVQRSGLPFIVVEDHPDPLIASVGADIHLCVYRSLRRLLEAGLTRIAYIGMTTSRMLFTDVDKFHAYLEAVDDVIHTVDFSLVRHAWPTPEYFYEQFRDMLRKAGPPQVVFITTDYVAPVIYQAAEEAGYRIPEHIQVLSCDSLRMAISPALASIRVPKAGLGALGLETLLKLIASPGLKRMPKLKLPREFVPGASLPSLPSL